MTRGYKHPEEQVVKEPEVKVCEKGHNMEPDEKICPKCGSEPKKED